MTRSRDLSRRHFLGGLTAGAAAGTSLWRRRGAPPPKSAVAL